MLIEIGVGVIAAAAVVLVAFLVPVLIQLRKTTQASTHLLRQMNEDLPLLFKEEGHQMAAEDSGFSSGAVAFAFLAGAIIGAGAALLLAPQTGAETRRLLRDYAEKAEEEIRERLPEAKAMLDSAIEKGKDLVE